MTSLSRKRTETECYLPATTQRCSGMAGRSGGEANAARSVALAEPGSAAGGPIPMVMQLRMTLTALAIAAVLLGTAATSKPAAASDRIVESIIAAALFYGLSHAQAPHFYDQSYYFDPRYYYFDINRGHWRTHNNRHGRSYARGYGRQDRHYYSRSQRHNQGHNRGHNSGHRQSFNQGHNRHDDGYGDRSHKRRARSHDSDRDHGRRSRDQGHDRDRGGRNRRGH